MADDDTPHEPVPDGVPVFDDDNDDDDDDSSETSSILTEIGSEEFPNYFVECNERLFPSHEDTPYPFPVDGYEQRVRDFRLCPTPPPISPPWRAYSRNPCGSCCRKSDGTHAADECPTRSA